MGLEVVNNICLERKDVKPRRNTSKGIPPDSLLGTSSDTTPNVEAKLIEDMQSSKSKKLE